MAEFKMKIPELNESSFKCPCSDFVCSIGGCACKEMKDRRILDGTDAAMMFCQEPILTWRQLREFNNAKNMFMTQYFNPRSGIKQLHEMKLDHAPSYYNRFKTKE